MSLKTNILTLFSVISISLLANPQIYFSFDKSARANFGGVANTANEIAGSSDEQGVIAKLSAKSFDKTPLTYLKTGIVGKALTLGNSSNKTGKQFYNYAPAKPLNYDEGAISFWMKPLDWTPKTTKEFHHVFGANVSNGDRIIIYQYMGEPNLILRIGSMSSKKPYSTTRGSMAKWEKGSWHHVTCNWNKKSIEIYLDGQKAGAAPRKSSPNGKITRFFFGEYWQGNPGNTLLDEVKIYSKPLSEAAVKKEYLRLASSAVSSTAPVTLGVSKKKTLIDGKISPNEYSIAVSGMNNSMNAPVQYSEKQSSCHLSWDDNNLYLGIISPAEKKLQTSQSGVDSEVWLDDAVEIFLSEFPNAPAFYQFIFNSGKGIYDSKNRNEKWNQKGAVWKSNIINGKWHFEIAMPWKNFNFKPQVGQSFRINLCREYKVGNKWTSFAPGDYFAVPSYALVKLLPANAPTVNLAEFKDLYKEKIDSSLSFIPQENDIIKTKISIPAAVFPYSFDETIKLVANKPSNFKLTGKAPENGNMDISIVSQNHGILYKNTLTYKNLHPVRLSCIYTDIPTQTLVMEMENTRINSGKNKIRVIMKDEKLKLVFDQTKVIDDSQVKTPVKFSIAKLPNGEHHLLYYVYDQTGKLLFSDTEKYAKYPKIRPWTNNKYGIADTVPIPWPTPKATVSTFSCWGRDMKFQKGIISSLTSQKYQLLSKPITLRYNGKILDFKSEIVQRKKATTTYKFTPISNATNLEVYMVAEFDGLLWFTVKMKPSKETIKDLALIIPMDRKNVTGFDDNANIINKIDIANAGNKTFVINPVEKPFFWCGGDDVGIMGGSSDRKGWYLKNKNNGMKINCAKDNVTITLSFVDTPLKVNKDRTLEFYLQPTPIKPKNIKMRSLREKENLICWGEYVTLYFGHKRPGKFSMRHINYFKNLELNKGQTVFYYNAPKGASPVSPEWNYFGKEWHCSPPKLGEYMRDAATPNKAARNFYLSTWGCLNSRDFFDFKLDSIASFTKNKEFHVNNLYFDLSWPRNCANSEHGCIWKDEFGYTHRNSDLKALRELMKRLYVNLKEKNKDGLFIGHTISTRIPSDAFYDAMRVGELYDRYIVNQVCYYDVLKPDLVRVAYASRNAEMQTSFIPQFNRSLMLFAPAKLAKYNPKEKESDRAIKHFLGYMLVHDLGSSHTPKSWRMKEFYETRDLVAGKAGKYTFYPYWKKNSPVQPNFTEGRKMVSVFSANKKASIVILNDTPKATTFNLTVDCKKLGISPNKEGRELFSNKKVTLKNDKLSIPAEQRECKVIVFN